MKKWILPMLMMVALVLAACGNSEKSEEQTDKDAGKVSSPETITYESETGPIEVPANPERVVVLSSYAGDLLKLGVNMVGVDSWSAHEFEF